MALSVISKLGKKPLIIAPTALLKNQWIENFTDLGVDIEDIATKIYDGPNKKVCVVTISAIENELRKDWEGLMNVLSQANYGIRITDEAHLHLKGVLKFDCIANIKRNYYLSATLGRSDEQEDDVLNRALLDADRFVGDKRYEEYQDEYINVYLQDIYYNASREICDEHFRYGKKGLISATYYRMLMDYQHGMPFYRNAMHMVKVAQKIKVQGKVLLLLPLLDAIAQIREEMKKDPYFSKFSISCVDGKMKQSEKMAALESDIIMSTTMSMGTGVDVSNLGAVVNFDQKSSLIILEQIVGRLRNRGFQTYYIDVCDHVKYARAFENWGMKRRRYMPYFPGISSKMHLLPKIMC
jgi:superfamily II DNA or RNA helicase